ncbi:MAG: hypothetical protein JST00_16440 [Deltaproteobacteria bacterium]|nr:hypothetical protein [Deltaproteobacteria bacterium]
MAGSAAVDADEGGSDDVADGADDDAEEADDGASDDAADGAADDADDEVADDAEEWGSDGAADDAEEWGSDGAADDADDDATDELVDDAGDVRAEDGVAAATIGGFVRFGVDGGACPVSAAGVAGAACAAGAAVVGLVAELGGRAFGGAAEAAPEKTIDRRTATTVAGLRGIRTPDVHASCRPSDLVFKRVPRTSEDFVTTTAADSPRRGSSLPRPRDPD